MNIVALIRNRALILVLASGFVLASCGTNDTPSVSLSAPRWLGPSGSQFKASFPDAPTVSTYKLSGVKQSQYGVGVLTNTIYVSRGDDPSEMIVWVVHLTNVVPPRRVNPFLRSYLSTTHGGRIIKWFGLPAAEVYVPGCNPSGQCVGTVGNLVVLEGTTLYFVVTQQNNQIAAQDEIRTFRIVK